MLQLGLPPQLARGCVLLEPRAEQLRDLVVSSRRAEQKSLHLAATQRLDLLQLASPAIASTMATESSPVARPLMKQRSILILSKGKLRR
jgi:hypothetical protein